MLLRNVRTLTVNLCDLVKGSRSICYLNATKYLKKFDACVLSSYNANFQTRRHSFINTFSYDKLFRRRFALTACHICKRHDEIERDSGDKRTVSIDIIYQIFFLYILLMPLDHVLLWCRQNWNTGWVFGFRNDIFTRDMFY